MMRSSNARMLLAASMLALTGESPVATQTTKKRPAALTPADEQRIEKNRAKRERKKLRNKRG